MAEELGLLETVALVEGEREVDEEGCEGRAADLEYESVGALWAVCCSLGGTYEAGCDAHGWVGGLLGLVNG